MSLVQEACEADVVPNFLYMKSQKKVLLHFNIIQYLILNIE